MGIEKIAQVSTKFKNAAKAAKIIKNAEKVTEKTVKTQPAIEEELLGIFLENIGTNGRVRVSFHGDTISDKLRRTSIISRLKNPTIELGYNAHSGQITGGVRIREGRKTVGQMAVNLDTTRGSQPIIQVRGEAGLAKDTKAVRVNAMFDANAKEGGDFVSNITRKNGNTVMEYQNGGANMQFSTNAQEIQAFEDATGIGIINQKAIDKIIQETGKKSFTQKLKKGLKTFTQKIKERKELKLKQQKDNEIKKAKKMEKAAQRTRTSMNGLDTRIREISKWEGKPTEATIENAKSIILKEMGYSDDVIRAEVQDLGGPNILTGCNNTVHGLFKADEGCLAVNGSILDTLSHGSVSTILVHELDHMDKFVKVAKKIGLERFEQLLGSKVNRSFYDRAMKQVDISDFDETPFVKALERKKALLDEAPMGAYGKLRSEYTYGVDEFEKSARVRENAARKTLGMDEYVAPGTHLEQVFPNVEKNLQEIVDAEAGAKGMKSSVYERVFGETVLNRNPELAALHKKVKSGSATEQEIEKFRQELQHVKTQLTGGILIAPDTEYEVKLLEDVTEALKQSKGRKTLVKNSAVTFFQALRAERGSQIIKNTAPGNKFIEDFVQYMNKHDSANQSLKGLLELTHRGDQHVMKWRGMPFNIAPELKTRIFNNRLFKEILQRYGQDSETLLNELLYTTC